MQTRDLKVVDGSVGSWIAARLSGQFGAVTLHVPEGYEAYARIFHPAADLEMKPMRWAEVAEALGKTAHPEMQWHAILGPSDPVEARGPSERVTVVGSKYLSEDPDTGEMEVDALCEILGVHTADPCDCYFGLCVIEGWLDDFTGDELKPLLRLAGAREYIVLAGPLLAVNQIRRDDSKVSSRRAMWVASESPDLLREHHDQISREAPNLIWPADRTWCVASEVDFDSTLVGGSAELIQAIIDSAAMEAWAVEPTTSLAADADKINARLR